jgi:7-carboxy-7-deazaguanine synthase
MTIHVSEIFSSLQGEGIYVGMPSMFVRLAGCGLRCKWCDTPYALRREQGKVMEIGAIVGEVDAAGYEHVVVTGGEPLLTPELPELLTALHEKQNYVTLETAATEFREVTCDLVSISPKLANSTPDDKKRTGAAAGHEKFRLNIDAIQQYIDRHKVQLKFVVESGDDLPEIEQILRQLSGIPAENIFLMCQARTKREHRELAPIVAAICLEKNYRFAPRLHVQLWGNRRGH